MTTTDLSHGFTATWATPERDELIIAGPWPTGEKQVVLNKQQIETLRKILKRDG